VTSRQLERGLLALLLLAFAGAAVAYTFITPLGQAPDELSHLGYVSGIAQHLQLPLAHTAEKQQPPLFYLLGAGVLKLTGDPRSVRYVSVVCGIATVLAVYAAGRRLFATRPLLAVGAAALVALLPEVQYLSGAVTDDSLAWLVGALLVWALIDVLQREVISPGVVFAGGVLAGAALLTKETVWVMAALLFVVVAVKLRGRLLGVDGLLLVVPILAIGGWWFVRNVATFHALTPPLGAITAHEHVLRSLSEARAFLSATAVSAIGSYGNGQHLVAISVLGARTLPSLLAGAVEVVAVLLVVVAMVDAWPRWDARRRTIVGVLAIAAAAVVLQFVVNAATLDVQPQSRYLLVMASAAALALAWAIARFFRRQIVVVVPLLVAVAIVFDASGLITASRF
jgi:Dolichyl-phosphate-mannose-protein mannosyltransferase